MIQGDVYWHKFKEPDKHRPIVILTRNEAIPYLTSLTVAPITTTFRNISSQVPLTKNDGMTQDCSINLDAIQTVMKDRLGSYITHLPLERMQEVRAAIEFAFGFDKL